MGPKANDWKRMRFKDNKVWVGVDREGEIIQENGKVLIRYQLDQDYEYWVHAKSVLPLDSLPGNRRHASRTEPTEEANTQKVSQEDTHDRSQSVDLPTDAITIFTDGASSGNPGPAGIGILLRFGGHEKEISENIGVATNNVAELTAIKTGLMAVKKREMPVRIYTDSTYALGVLTKGWKVKKNPGLVNSTKSILSKFSKVKLLKVKGHAGDPGNERADRLARDAVKKTPKGTKT